MSAPTKKIFTVKGVPFTASKNRFVCLEPVYLDIETSNNHAEEPQDLITWISSIQVLFNDHYYLLRTPEELMEFYKYIYKELSLEPKEGKLLRKVITYIHHASYDLSYLVPYFMEYLPHFDNEGQGLIEGPNKFLNYQQGPFEWRCSLRLCNMSLAKWSNEMNIEHRKLIGFYDYEKTIYQDDELTAEEEAYDKNDVYAIKECLAKQNEYHGDDLITTTPLTFTGYVRRDLRKSCAKNKRYREKYFINNRLDADLFYALQMSYAGGVTHNNRFYKGMCVQAGKIYDYMGKKIPVNVIGHRDFKSHYPTQMACRKFPLGRPHLMYDTEKFSYSITIDEILSLYPEYSTVSMIRFYDVELKSKEISMPFMQFSKCLQARFDRKRLDNGRVIYATGSFTMYLDNLTLQILSEQYDMTYEVIKCWKIKNDYLPPEIMNVVDKYFKGKSDKKNIVNDLTDKYGKLDPRTVSAQFDLSQTKILLNSIYGCTATSPLRDKYALSDDFDFIPTRKYETREEIQEGLDEFYSGYNNFLQYTIGCYVTAYARYELYEFIKTIGYDRVLYVDTDSAFYIKDDATEKAIALLNEEKRKTARFVTLDNGDTEYYDNFGVEPDCIAFKGLHSKCYGVVTSHGLELTIAGVPARTLVGMENGEPVYLTREAELSGDETDPIKALDKLDDDYTFHINTGRSALYVGATGYNTPRVPTMVNVNGHVVSTAGGCVIRTLKTKVVHDIEYDLSSYEYYDGEVFD